MNKLKYVITKEKLIDISDTKTSEDLYREDDRLYIHGNNFFYTAKRLEDLGFRVLVRIDDSLREDFNVYNETYSLKNFLNNFGEDYQDGIIRIDIYHNRTGYVNIFQSGLMYVEIFNKDNKFSLLRALQDIHGILLESYDN